VGTDQSAATGELRSITSTIMTTEEFVETLAAAEESEMEAVVAGAGERESNESVVAFVPEDVETSLATDTLFELLKNQRRRDALDYLRANDGWATLSDMAEHIAALENDVPVGEINSKQRKRVYIGLYQCHLPKMAAAGVVDFDKNRGTIGLADLAAQLYPYLDADDAGHPEGDSPTTASATGEGGATVDAATRVQSSALAGVGAAALAGVAGVPGFELLSPAAWAAVCGVSLLAAAAVPYLPVRD
jgi:hypothetical protein